MEDLVWNDIKASFGLEEYCEKCVLKDLNDESIEYLLKEGLVQGILQYLQSEVEKRLRIHVAPAFWKHFMKDQPCQDEEESANLFQSKIYPEENDHQS